MTTNIDSSSLLTIIISLIISLVVHEFMHAYAAHLLGDRTAQERGRLSLNPLNHIDPFMTIGLPIITLLLFGVPLLAAKPVPFDPDRIKYNEFGPAIVAAAGPLSNLAMAIIGALILNATSGTGFAGLFLGTFVYLNVALFVFNSLPIPPLDGSRVLYAFAPEGLQDFMRSIEPYGLFIVFALVLGVRNFLQNIDQFILNLLP
jgi:Zn-dependent protease